MNFVPAAKPMKVILWLALLIPNILVDLLAFPLAPLIALFDESTAHKWFSWFLTPDNPMTGDVGHELRWIGKPTYIKKVGWLWGNGAYGFTSTVLRARSNGPVTIQGNPKIGNRPFVPGLVIRTTPEGYWQFYYIKRTIKDRCLRINLGWKLWGPDQPWMYVCSINPLMGTSST